MPRPAEGADKDGGDEAEDGEDGSLFESLFDGEDGEDGEDSEDEAFLAAGACVEALLHRAEREAGFLHLEGHLVAQVGIVQHLPRPLRSCR